MTSPPILLRTAALAAVLTAFPAAALRAQQEPPRPHYVYTAPAESAQPRSPPSVVRLCTDPAKPNNSRSCGTWIWGDGHYDAAAKQGVTEILLVQSLTADAMVLRLADAAHPGKDGTLEVFGGKISSDGNSIPDGMSLTKDGTTGHFRAYWGSALEATPESESTSASIPKELHFCAQYCFTLKWDGGRYVNTTSIPAIPNWSTIWTVESFTRESVILHRIDSNGFTGDYRGQISPEGDSMFNRGAASPYLTWGAALNTLPGSEAERALRAGVPMQPQMSQADTSMLEMLFGLFSPGVTSSSSSDAKPYIGCAPGNSGCTRSRP